MTTEFPTLLYKCFPPGTPGTNPGNGGHTYKSKGAADQAAYDLLSGDGWFPNMQAAEEAVDLANAPDPLAVQTSSMTPEERAAAADQLQMDAADALTKANEALVVDQANADAAEKVLADASSKADLALAKKEAADADYQVTALEKSAALADSISKNKVLTSSKLRQAAADRALDDAAGKVLTMGSLLTKQKQQALDKAAAKQKALAAAEAKEKEPPPPDVPPGPAPGVRVKGRSL